MCGPPLQWRLSAFRVLEFTVLSLFAHRTHSPAQTSTALGRVGTVCALLSIQNPIQPQTMWLTNKCLLNETSSQSGSQALYFYRRVGGGKQDPLKQPKCKDLLGAPTGAGPLCPVLQHHLA